MNRLVKHTFFCAALLSAVALTVAEQAVAATVGSARSAGNQGVFHGPTSLTPHVPTAPITYIDANGNTVTTAVSSPSVTGAQALARAQVWVDAHVPYNQGAHYQGYREDCSGFVSMAWGLSTPGLTTDEFPQVGKFISKSALAPGDALLNDSAGDAGHVTLFQSWADSAHTRYNGYEEDGDDGAIHHQIDYPYFPGDGTFRPFRYNGLVPATPAYGGLAGVGDVTGDGHPDYVAVHTKVDGGALMLYKGPGFYGSKATRVGTDWNSMTDLTGFADAGTKKLLAVQKSTGYLYEYTGPKFTGKSGREKLGHGWNSMTELAGVGDVTGDGVPDLVAVQKSTGYLYLYKGPGFSGATRKKLGTAWNSVDQVTGVGDVTGDGVPDLVAVKKSTGDLYLYKGPGFSGSTRKNIGHSWNQMRELTGIGDVTGDHKGDLLAIDGSGKLWRYNAPGFSGTTRTLIGPGWN